MRITADAKRATHERILEAAHRLFCAQGFEPTTTRDISREAEIATGTLFNYFASKEAIAARLVAEALEQALEDFKRKRRPGAALDEDLFLLISAGLRRLRRNRKYLPPAIQSIFHPSLRGAANRGAEELRISHLEAAGRLFAEHGLAHELSPLDTQLYWTLYSGVLAFWSTDSSPRQEDTLALLDQSLRMFVDFLHAKLGGSPPTARHTSTGG